MQGGRNGQPITAIFLIAGGRGVHYSYLDDMKGTILRGGEILKDATEIDEKLFKYHLDVWSTITMDDEKVEAEPEMVKEEVQELTKFLVRMDGIDLIGYSQRSSDELNRFVQDVDQFAVKDSAGVCIALLRRDVIKKASFFYNI